MDRSKTGKLMNRKGFSTCAYAIATLIAIACGLSAMGRNDFFEAASMGVCAVFMALSFTFVLIGGKSIDALAKGLNGKLSKMVIRLALLSFLWLELMTWFVFLMFTKGYVPLGMEVSSLGSLLNGQFVIVFLWNLLVVAFLLYRLIRYDESIALECYIAMSVMYMAVMYSGLLHRITTFQLMLQNLVVRTIVILVIAGCYMMMTKVIERK